MIIEFQGTIDSSGQPLENEVLGHLTWRADNSEALLLIGHHLLEGKMVDLEKPFALIRQTPGEDPESQHSSMLIDAIIRRKLVFRNRPKPLVTQQQVAAN
ncbi:hypothetical protein Q1695_008090 [Nippostrongylus brasiliensis]|nr:hypothetical protein Q1695_008076 [Nippostrongylus brasiliensis]WKX88172.1 hypothetical protein Q1695_008080 [Nippostrongylus brasiliensis]WKX88187.1 hypothetical protein Q1695_008090 [Nippostrongylus brasiliensis]